MAAPVLVRDSIQAVLTWWLSNRPTSGKTVGYRFLSTLASPLDNLLEQLLQGLYAAWPGAGTPTALGYIGRSRGIERGNGDTNEQYAEKLRGWLDRWETAGTELALAREVHEYLSSRPRVRVINRHGHWLTMNHDGTVEEHDAAWDWDSVSHPERANFWSELWIVIYTSEFPHAGQWGDGRRWGARDGALGHVVPREQRAAIKNLLATWKSAHSKIRCVIWTTDDALFDPENPASCPDGTWGCWGVRRASSRTASRITTTCRYWEPE